MSIDATLDMIVKKQINEIANRAVEIMKEEAPSDTGKLRESIKKEQVSNNEIFVGTDLEYAYYVEHGRGEVKPKRAKALWGDGIDKHWTKYWGSRPSHPIPYAGPAKANDLVGRTAKRIKQEIGG